MGARASFASRRLLSSILNIGFITQNPSLDIGNKVVSSTRQDSLLELIWVDENLSGNYKKVILGVPLGNSDHNCVILNPAQASPGDSKDRVVPVLDSRASGVHDFVDCL